MEKQSFIRQSSPHDSANFLSKIFFVWVYPLFFKGLKRPLRLEDLHRCPKHDEAQRLSDKLEKNWNEERKKSKPKFTKALIKTFGIFYVPLIAVILFEECVIRVIQPILLGLVVQFFALPSEEKDDQFFVTCFYAAGVCLCSASFIILHHISMLAFLRLGMRIRIASSSLIYKKSLKLSHSALGQTTVGQVVNLLSNDVNRFDEFSVLSAYLIVGPAQCIIFVYVMWQYLGISSLSGLVVLLLFIPFQTTMGKLFANVRSKTAKLTDSRIRIMNEIISGMKVIKMYTWEKPFADLIADIRKKEVDIIRKACLYKAINLSVFFGGSKFILYVCFITFVLMGNRLNASAVFVTMSLFNALRVTFTLLFVQVIGFASEAYVSCQRIQKFLLLDEIKSLTATNSYTDIPKNIEIIQNNGLPGIQIEQLEAKWNQEMEEPTLSNISVDVKSGELLAVIGPVGSGKSSLLMSILGELPLLSGKIHINGKIAFASQESWCFNSSVQDNILFGNEYNEDKYNQIVKVCALVRDFALFPYGDKTLVGEKGVSLSGGQKARITLARALYNDADIYLLDDPLSAVDAAVAKHIFEKCINGYLKDKVRILVTHQLQFIRKATQVLVLKDGKSIARGTYDDLLNSGLNFVSLLGETKPNEKVTQELDEKQLRSRSYSQLSSSDSHFDESLIDEEFEQPKIAEEGKETGSIKASVYWAYIKAGSRPFLMTLTIASTIVSQVIFHGSDILLTIWTNLEDERHYKDDHDINETLTTTSLPSQEVDELFYSILYTSLILALFITAFIRTLSFFSICMNSSIKLHNRIFYCLLRAPIFIFDNNPVGRILNRFSRDLGTVDETMPGTAYDLNLTLTTSIGITIVVAMVNPYLIIPAVFLIYLTLKVRDIFLKSAREVKRYEGMTRSPLFSHISTTLTGISTIRAFKVQNKFMHQFFHYQDDHSGCWFLFISASRTLGFIVDWIAFLYTSSITVVLMLFYKGIESGSAGLAITSALMLTGMTQWGVRQSTELESQMTCVERILEYSKLPSEAELESTPDKKPAKEWPEKGHIEFTDVYMTYENVPKPALNNLNFKIRGGEKIGVVGRTGAGKSSLLSALFRMTEPDGIITIDRIVTKSIGLHDLRKVISIIPQEPVVFTGPIRRNIDPFGEHTDERLWQVLDEVQLKEVVADLPAKLDSELSEGGSNLSVGQRQLICLARAILRENKILVLDEATANVDHQTDSLIQNTIREKFSKCTVITIAHRLNTIIDCDRVMVLDAGKIVEFDEPYALLQNHSSFFAEMVRQTGKTMAAQLIQSANDIHFNKQNVI